MVQLGGHARYAIYWAPPAGSWLEAFGASWLGWDAAVGEQRMRPQLGRALARLTEGPARYGFHATLKAPFRLAEDTDASTLDAALQSFAAARAPVAAPGLTLDAGLGFVALRPSGAAPALDGFALDVVEAFEPHRAPLTEAELARRRGPGLSATQEAALMRHGYPYTGSEFRFHLTLTGPVDPATAETVIEAAAPMVTPHLGREFHLEEIALFADPGAGQPFRLISRYPLTG